MNVQIPEELFISLIKFHILGLENESANIVPALKSKLKSIADRDLYTRYKTAKTEEERQLARTEYLESKGISHNFRWN